MTPPLLEAERLSVGYGAVAVIHDIDLHVNAAEVVVMLGPNGAGKTTTLLALSGDISQQKGTIRIDGASTRSPLHRRCAKNKMAFVTEERSIFTSLTTAENLRLGSGGVDAAVELMPELRPLLKRKAGLLSGGEQQILTLARALASKPRLLLADELSLGLAPLVVGRLHGAVREAADRGIGVLLVEQYARRALAIADRVYVMRQGRIVFSGPAAEMRERIDELEALYLSSEGGATEEWDGAPRDGADAVE